MGQCGIVCRQTEENKTFDECLKCKVSTCLPYAYRHLITRHNQHEEIKGIRASGLASCPLKEYLYNKNDVYSKYQGLHWTAIRGSLVHTALEQEPEDKTVIKEKRYNREIEGINISGKMDRLKLFAEKDKLYCQIEDYKTCAKIIYEKIPKPEHVIQTNIYAWLLRGNGIEPRSIVIHYVDMGDCATVSAPVLANAEIEKYIKERIEVFKPMYNGGVPKGEPGWICNLNNREKKSYCEVRHLCPVWA